MQSCLFGAIEAVWYNAIGALRGLPTR